eukprot:GHVQ01005116.1.p1 GENE.GHVQ01005116.1~~GHVQ01005116.1.p1  ORF type:complete len:162 (+),score=17.83 GHVQ01005116.1:502-987(+)
MVHKPSVEVDLVHVKPSNYVLSMTCNEKLRLLPYHLSKDKQLTRFVTEYLQLPEDTDSEDKDHNCRLVSNLIMNGWALTVVQRTIDLYSLKLQELALTQTLTPDITDITEMVVDKVSECAKEAFDNQWSICDTIIEKPPETEMKRSTYSLSVEQPRVSMSA